MKKWIKILLVTLGIIAVLVVTTILLLPPIAKNYLEKHSKELVGRQITIEKLRFNVLNGKLRIDQIAMLEPDDSTTIAGKFLYSNTPAAPAASADTHRRRTDRQTLPERLSGWHQLQFRRPADPIPDPCGHGRKGPVEPLDSRYRRHQDTQRRADLQGHAA